MIQSNSPVSDKTGNADSVAIEPLIMKRKRGRPRGSKTKITLIDKQNSSDEEYKRSAADHSQDGSSNRNKRRHKKAALAQ